MQKWYLTIVLGIIGVFFLTVTYIALYLSKKNEKNISGAPFFGGVIIAVAFLLSPIKWLALLGLLDYGIWVLPYVLLSDYFQNQRFKKIYIQQNYINSVRDNSKSLRVTIPERNEELILPYITNSVFELKVPKLLFAICTNKDGLNFLLINKYKKDNIEIIEVNKNTILLEELKSKDINLTVKIEIIENI